MTLLRLLRLNMLNNDNNNMEAGPDRAEGRGPSWALLTGSDARGGLLSLRKQAPAAILVSVTLSFFVLLYLTRFNLMIPMDGKARKATEPNRIDPSPSCLRYIA